LLLPYLNLDSNLNLPYVTLQGLCTSYAIRLGLGLGFGTGLMLELGLMLGLGLGLKMVSVYVKFGVRVQFRS
jgi:hypothetical protein